MNYFKKKNRFAVRARVPKMKSQGGQQGPGLRETGGHRREGV